VCWTSCWGWQATSDSSNASRQKRLSTERYSKIHCQGKGKKKYYPKNLNH
jgi:hypothetical protein